MTNPDYRAMCSELAEELVNEYGYCTEWEKGLPLCESNVSELLTRARALLAQPEPVAPTDQEIEEWADACPEAPLEEMDPEIHGWRRCFTAKEFGETIRAAIARWSHPTPQPVAVGPTDEEVMELMPQQMRDDLAAAARALTSDMPWPDNPKAAVAMRIILNRHAVDHALAVLSRWGHLTPQPVAKRPTLMERAMAGDATAAKQFLHQAGFTDKQGQWLPQYQPIPEAQ
jgi:hypothetical protein